MSWCLLYQLTQQLDYSGKNWSGGEIKCEIYGANVSQWKIHQNLLSHIWNKPEKMSPNLTILTSCEAESKFPNVKIKRIFGQPFQGRSWISFYCHYRKQYIKIIVILRGNKNYVVKTVREQNSVGVVFCPFLILVVFLSFQYWQYFIIYFSS